MSRVTGDRGQALSSANVAEVSFVTTGNLPPVRPGAKYEGVAVVIPCLDEEATIGKVVEDFSSALPGARIYVYDNASTDSTSQRALEAGAVVVREPKRGKGVVVRRMLRDVDADVYLLVDGDDTYPAAAAPGLVAPVLCGYLDMVVGDRISGGEYGRENKRPLHGLGNALVSNLIRSLYGECPTDTMSGYRAMSRAFVDCLPILTDGFELETELTIHAIDKDWRVGEVPVAYRDRPSGSSSKLDTFRDGARVMATILRLFRDYRPLPFFLSFSAVLAACSLLLGVPVIGEWLETGLVPRMPTAVLATGVGGLAAVSAVCGLVLSAQASESRRSYALAVTRAWRESREGRDAR